MIAAKELPLRITCGQAHIGADEYVGGLDRRFGYLWSLFPDQGYYSYLGRGGQELFILPQENMVIVFTGALQAHQGKIVIEHSS